MNNQSTIQNGKADGYKASASGIIDDANTLKKDAKQLLDRACHDGKEAIDEAKSKAADQIGVAREQGMQKLQKAEEFVRANPSQSLAYAFLGGLVVSLFLRKG